MAWEFETQRESVSERERERCGEREKKQRPAEMGAAGVIAVLSGARRQSLNLCSFADLHHHNL